MAGWQVGLSFSSLESLATNTQKFTKCDT